MDLEEIDDPGDCDHDTGSERFDVGAHHKYGKLDDRPCRTLYIYNLEDLER